MPDYIFSDKEFNNLSDETKMTFAFAIAKKLDAIGLMVYSKELDNIGDKVNQLRSNEFSVREIIQLAQSLSNPNSIGNIQSKTEWAKTATNRKILEAIKPYSSDGYSSVAISSTISSCEKLILPVRTNLSGKNGTVVTKSASRYKKFVEKIEKTFGTKIVENFKSTPSYETAKIRTGFLGKNKVNTININCDNSMTTEFDKFAIIFNSIAKQLYKTDFENSIKDLSFSDEEKLAFRYCVEKLATLGIERATILEDNNFSPVLKLDEALRFDFFKTLATLDGKRNNAIQKIVECSKEIINSYVTTFFSSTEETLLQTIKSNMINIGFTYPKEPENHFDAIFLANSIENIRIQNSILKPIVNSDNYLFGYELNDFDPLAYYRDTDNNNENVNLIKKDDLYSKIDSEFDNLVAVYENIFDATDKSNNQQQNTDAAKKAVDAMKQAAFQKSKFLLTTPIKNDDVPDYTIIEEAQSNTDEVIYLGGKIENQTIVKEKVKTCISSSTIQSEILAFGGKLNSMLLTREETEKFFENNNSSLITFIIESKLEEAQTKAKEKGKEETSKTKYYKKAIEYSSEISEKFSEKVNEKLKLTSDLALKKLNEGTLETTNISKLFREANNEEGKNKTSKSIINETLTKTIKQVIEEKNGNEK